MVTVTQDWRTWPQLTSCLRRSSRLRKRLVTPSGEKRTSCREELREQKEERQHEASRQRETTQLKDQYKEALQREITQLKEGRGANLLTFRGP